MKRDKIFWVIKSKDGSFMDYDSGFIFNTRKGARESGILIKGDKIVKVKLVEVN
jgi:hypothetical protein